MAYADEEVADEEVDIGFYNLIHHLVGISPQGKNAERRRQRREPFPTVQRIAPRREQGMPDESDFIAVLCRNRLVRLLVFVRGRWLGGTSLRYEGRGFCGVPTPFVPQGRATRATLQFSCC